MARRRLWWGWLLTVALACAARSSHAESRANPVEKLAADAANAYRAGDYGRAAQLLERAYKIQPVSALLYNLAKAYEKLGDDDKAADLYGRYASAEDADPRLKQKAEARVTALAPPPPKPRPRKPPPPDPAEQPSEKEQPAERKPAEQQSAPPPATVEKPAPPAPKPEPAEPPEVRAKRRDKAIGIALTAVGGGALISAIGLSGSVLSIKSQFDGSLDESYKIDRYNAALPQSIAADVLYVVGAAAVAVGAYFLWRGLHREAAPQAKITTAGLRF
jgi:outer membrane biosynthesis protein TonB